MKNILHNLNHNEPQAFAHEILQLLYEHTCRPTQDGGEFPLPEILFSSVNHDRVYKEINKIK